MPFAQKRMGFSSPPKLFLRGDSKNAENPLGKTAHYDPGEKSITIYITGRHPKDIMRSLSHELVHHSQCCRGDLDGQQETSPGYAQSDDHMREMEREAYEVGNMCFRDWEDGIKSTIYFEHLQKGAKTMSTKDWKNGELKSLISEAWGFKMDLSKLNENKDSISENEDQIFAPSHYCIHHGGVHHEGKIQMAEAVQHVEPDKNGHISHYDMKLEDGTVLENVAAEDIQITDASLAESHDPGKRDHKPMKKKGKQFANSDELDGDSDGIPKWADKDDPANKGKKGKKKLDEEEEEIEERRGRGRADPRIQRAPDNRARPLEEEEELQEFRPPRNQYGNFEYNDGAPAPGGGSREDEGGDDDEEDQEEVKERRARGRNDRHIRGTPDDRLRENIKDIIRQALRAEGNNTNGQER